MKRDYNYWLDFILEKSYSFIKEREVGNFEGFGRIFANNDIKNEITKELKTKYEIDYWESDEMIKKLFDDGMIDSEENVRISLKGITFLIKDKGYKRKHTNDLIKVWANRINVVVVFFGVLFGGTYSSLKIWEVIKEQSEQSRKEQLQHMILDKLQAKIESLQP